MYLNKGLEPRYNQQNAPKKRPRQISVFDEIDSVSPYKKPRIEENVEEKAESFISQPKKNKRLTVRDLRIIISEYNKSVTISGYANKTRKELKEILKEKGLLPLK